MITILLLSNNKTMWRKDRMLEKLFKLRKNGTDNVKTEVLAGITTFL